MNKEFFLIAIGGTGMRCLESFIHLCSIGMFDRQTINVLAIDTDFNNGNLERTRNLIENYVNLKKDANGEQQALQDSFFSAIVNYFEFTPEYTGNRANFREISRSTGQPEATKRQNQVIANLLMDPATQNFNLSHGYRGQTHLGSHLMYHAIKSELYEVDHGFKRPAENSIVRFIDRLKSNGEGAKVFIMGSIFGGTGASSIPIIPRAFRDALKVLDSSEELNPLYGATLLTNYFGFTKPKGAQLREQHVIADSGRFALNSQAALKFYNADKTVRKYYCRLYHVGWPGLTYDYDKSELRQQNKAPEGTTTTGGKHQRNPAHVIELMCATAAMHFFYDKKIDIVTPLQQVYRSIDYEPSSESITFEFVDFVANADVHKFKRKLSAFAVFAIMIQNDFNGRTKGLLKNLERSYAEFLGKYGYDKLSDEAVEPLDALLSAFIFHYTNDNVFSNWLQQVQVSTRQPGFLDFNNDIYAKSSSTLQRANYSRLWQNSENHFPSSGGFMKRLMGSKPFESFITAFRSESKLAPEGDINKRVEFLANHIYRTIDALHNIKK
ncbi:MAG: hypothetical protein AAGN35_03945 [Bacteroidota bacterium]